MSYTNHRAIVARLRGGNMATNMDRVVGIANDAILQVTREGAGFTLEERTSHMAEVKATADAAMAALEAEATEAKKAEAESKDAKSKEAAEHEEKHGKGKKAA